MTKKNKQAILLSAVILGVGVMLAKNKQRKRVPVKGLDGGGFAALFSEIDSWTGATGRNKKAARKAFLAESMPSSVTFQDYQKWLGGAQYGGGYTQQDEYLLVDTFG